MLDTVVRNRVAGSSGDVKVVVSVSVTHSWKPNGSMGHRLVHARQRYAKFQYEQKMLILPNLGNEKVKGSGPRLKLDFGCVHAESHYSYFKQLFYNGYY